MRAVIDFDLEEISLNRGEILRSQGVPDEAELSGNFERLFLEAVELFRALAEPKGVIDTIDITGFEEVFRGEGLNERKNPVDEIFRKSDCLALFAATLGPVLSSKVSEMFDSGNYADGYMLDSISSCAADKLADLAAAFLKTEFAESELSDESLHVLPYSPGYCGWHISGQKKLFEALQPEEIGITLNDSCLMSPVKSVSGVLIGGQSEIHEFDNSYPFCKECTARTCIERMRNLK